jgi:uncharacterized protein (UPF0264 family)
MLASEASAEEAEMAVRHCADMIDVKDVGCAFGSATPSLARAIAGAVAQRRPISAVVSGPLAHAAAIVEAGASYIKFGLFP